jgi:hypothetical protein
MVLQTAKPQSIFPDLPRTSPAVSKEGEFTQDWSLGFSLLFQALQKNYSNEGLLLPPLTAAELTTIQNMYAPYTGSPGIPLPQDTPDSTQTFLPDISGAMVFDSTNRVPKVFIITYDSSTPPNVLTAAWKTYTLT